MKTKYCYWSLAVGDEQVRQVQQCVDSARDAGVFRDFHILTTGPLKNCESYAASSVDVHDALKLFVYLKAGISRLSYDYLVYLAPESRFLGSPVNPLGPLAGSPVHAPLEMETTNLPETSHPFGMTGERYQDIFRQNGVRGPVFVSRAAFWIIQREAINPLCDLAAHFWRKLEVAGVQPTASLLLSYAAQMFIPDPAPHLASARPDLWRQGAPEETFSQSPDAEDLISIAGYRTDASIVHFGKEGFAE